VVSQKKEKVYVKCPRCGIETTEEAYSCPNCGGTLRIREQPLVQKLIPLWLLIGINTLAIIGIVQIYRSVANAPSDPYGAMIENMPWAAFIVILVSIVALVVFDLIYLLVWKYKARRFVPGLSRSIPRKVRLTSRIQGFLHKTGNRFCCLLAGCFRPGEEYPCF